MFAIVFLIYFLITTPVRAFELDSLPYANFSFSQTEAFFGDNHDLKVALMAATVGVPINALEATVKYDPNVVQVKEIIIEKSFCRKDMFVAKKIDSQLGTVHIACGLPSPGFNGKGTVAELVLSPILEQHFVLKFGNNSKMLVNNGKGIEVLSLKIGGDFNITSQGGFTFNPDIPSELILRPSF
ncbi:MAG: cohesin domain-containing protein [Candidatus Giovannonibacteria bacterium]|nr:cohesin domain-containing protein [Candidatus Giovannonibacteria bacterium]